MKGKSLIYLALLGANLLYACVTFFTKNASLERMFSPGYLLFMAGAVCVMGLYAIIWQQLIKRVPMGEAYMFKGTSLIFVLCFSVLFFGEAITINNIVGAALIVGGIVLYARS